MRRCWCVLAGAGVYLCLLLLCIGKIPVADSIASVAPETVLPIDTTPEPAPELRLPCKVPGTDLLVESLTPYDGNYFEDGLDRQVCDIACIVLRNTGSFPVEWVRINLHGQQELLVFEGNTIPAGAAVMILEKNAKPYTKDGITHCSGYMLEAQEPWQEERQLQLVELDMGTVSVTNVSGRRLEKIRIYYKTYHSDVDIYLGGVSYFICVEALEAGETVLLQPQHYAQGYSRVVRINTH